MKNSAKPWGGRRIARLAVAAAVAVLAPVGAVEAKPAHAGGAKPRTSFAALSWVSDNCQDGATCTHAASADRSGTQAGQSSITRPAAFSEEEWSAAYAAGSRTFTLAAPAPSLKLTYTWRTDGARSTATATGPEGAAVGRVFARGTIVGCTGCEMSDDPTHGHGAMVVDAYAPAGSTVSDTATAGETATHSFTVRGPGGGAVPPGKYTLRGTTVVFSYVGCRKSTYYVLEDAGLGDPVSTDCLPELIGHSGSASAEASMQLLDIAAEVTG